jgi:cytochrome bd-type quinol oxidase subunit 2
MRVAERATSVAAVIAVLSTLACCLPFGFLGAMGLAGVSVWAQTARPWLLGSALVLLVLGFVQLYRGRTQCRKRSPISISLFWVAVVIVLIIVLFPQVIAHLVAG